MKPIHHYLFFLCLLFAKNHDNAFAACCGHTLSSHPLSSPVQTIQTGSSFEFDHFLNQDIFIQPDILSENDDDDFISTRKKTPASHSPALNIIFSPDDLFKIDPANRRLYERPGYPSHYRYQVLRV